MKRTITIDADDYDLPVQLQAVQKTEANWNGQTIDLSLGLMLAGRYEILRTTMTLATARELLKKLKVALGE
jgi:hypothetical protein